MANALAAATCANRSAAAGSAASASAGPWRSPTASAMRSNRTSAWSGFDANASAGTITGNTCASTLPIRVAGIDEPPQHLERLGHEGAGIVVDVGPGVRVAEEGRPRHPALYARVPAVQVVPVAQDQPLHGDPRDAGQGRHAGRTSRFSLNNNPVFHYMGMSTFANYTVLPEIALAKIRADAPFDKVCYIGCGVTTGIGAVINTAKVEPGANVVVFGLGGIGLNVVQGARMAGANMIIGVDLNPAREEIGREVRHDALRQSEEIHGDIVDTSSTSRTAAPTTASNASATWR